jgi:hypothetical protein
VTLQVVQHSMAPGADFISHPAPAHHSAVQQHCLTHAQTIGLTARLCISPFCSTTMLLVHVGLNHLWR